MPAQTLNFIVYIHLLILAYKYHRLSELWFLSCIHDSLFVIGNDFMTLAFFLISSLMSLNILFDFWHYYDYFVTSPFIPDLLTVDLWKTKQEKIFNSSDCFFFSSQWFQQSSVITNHCTNKTKNWISWWPWGKTSVLGQIRQ